MSCSRSSSSCLRGGSGGSQHGSASAHRYTASRAGGRPAGGSCSGGSSRSSCGATGFGRMRRSSYGGGMSRGMGGSSYAGGWSAGTYGGTMRCGGMGGGFGAGGSGFGAGYGGGFGSGSAGFSAGSFGGGGFGGENMGILSNNEKLTMQNLNDRLASYLDKVRSLERENARLEQLIREWYQKQGPTGRKDYSHYYTTIEDLQNQVGCSLSQMRTHQVDLLQHRQPARILLCSPSASLTAPRVPQLCLPHTHPTITNEKRRSNAPSAVHPMSTQLTVSTNPQRACSGFQSIGKMPVLTLQAGQCPTLGSSLGPWAHSNSPRPPAGLLPPCLHCPNAVFAVLFS